MAIEITRSDYGFRCAYVFIKIHKYVASSRHQLIRRPTILIASLQDADFFYYLFKNVSISSKQKPMRLVYCVISCDGLGGSIACAWNSQMASSLSQIHVVYSTMKMSSFPLKIEKNIHAWKAINRFYSSSEPKIEKIPDGSPTFASHRSAHFFGLFLVSGRVSSG